MDRYERLNTLLGLLADRGRLEVEDVAAELAVSTATVRRDFDHLAQQQLVTRTRGGAVAHSVAYDLPLRYKKQRHATEKQRIGRAAAVLVEPGMTVGLNGGTTTTEVARALATRADLNGGNQPTLTVVTNAVNIANELTVRPHVKIVLTGGVARPQSYELIGPLATRILEGLSLDVAFLGVDGIDPAAGATAFHEGEADINSLIARQARRVAVVADASKLGQRTFARICPTSDVDVLVTDTDAAPETVAGFRDAGLEVVRA